MKMQDIKWSLRNRLPKPDSNNLLIELILMRTQGIYKCDNFFIDYIIGKLMFTFTHRQLRYNVKVNIIGQCIFQTLIDVFPEGWIEPNKINSTRELYLDRNVKYMFKNIFKNIRSGTYDKKIRRMNSQHLYRDKLIVLKELSQFIKHKHELIEGQDPYIKLRKVQIYTNGLDFIVNSIDGFFKCRYYVEDIKNMLEMVDLSEQ